jgi:hypothetical protein
MKPKESMNLNDTNLIERALPLEPTTVKTAFTQRTFNMGRSAIDLTKALALSDALADQALIEKMRHLPVQSSIKSSHELTP